MKTLKSIALALTLPFLVVNIVQAADYFWIGGSGNWEDITHWATTSGGAVTHDQTPTANDDVIFDANSFTAANQTVTINNNVAFARSIDFSAATSAPTLIAGNNVILSVFGSVQLINAMTFNFDGTLFFGTNAAGTVIDLAGHDAGENITFDGSGQWNVVSDINVASTIRIISGDISFSNNQINCAFFYSQSTANRNIAFDNSTLTVTGTTIDFQDDGSIFNTYTIRIAAENLTWTATNNARVNITASYAKIFTEGLGSIDFGTLSTVDGIGSFALINLDGLTSISASQQLDLTKNSAIQTSIVVGELLLYGSYSYVFEATETVELETLNAIGSCQAAILIASSISGVPTNWTANQPITGEYLSISDVNVNGTANTANNSVDLGNNTGWTFNEKIAEDFFWIGGTGNWDDGNHWSTTSGGTPSGCVPTAADDVFFDANSFNGAGQAVSINIANAVCHSMTWENVTNNPSLIGPETNRFQIYGSLVFDTNMTHLFEGDYYFLSNELNNTITSSGQVFNKDVHFNNINGGWNLIDAFESTYHVYFTSGDLNTQSQNFNCFRFDSNSKNIRSLTLGSSLITLTQIGGNYFYLWLDSDNLIFDSGTSTIMFTGLVAECVARGNQTLTFYNIIFTDILSTLNTISQGSTQHIFNKVTYLNDGSIVGYNIIDTLVLKNSSSYQVQSNTNQEIDVIMWDDICDGLIGLSSFGSGATIRLGTTQVLEGFNISKITFDNDPPISAQQSVDGGFNQGVDFVPAVGRDLYWVGGDGVWDDMANWSLVSGGAGGECIPTIIDNVFFDDNSFNANTDNIFLQNGQKAFCRNLTFTVTNHLGVLRPPILEVAGNIDLQEQWKLATVHLVGGQGLQTIRASGSEIINIEIRGSADVQQLDDLVLLGGIFFFDAVTYVTNDFLLEVDQLNISNRNDAMPALDFGTSLIRITGEKIDFFYPFTLSGEGNPMNNLSNATYEVTGNYTGFNLNSNDELGNVTFTDPTGMGIVTNFFFDTNFRSLTFRGDGTMDGDAGAVMDTLVLSGGKSYIFEGGESYTINSRLQARGNNCIPISWQTSQNGVNVQLTMPADLSSLDVDFVEMNGISIVCCSEFFAGNNSTNIGNSNQGWIFGDPDNNPVDEGFFGPDIIICDNNSLTLMPFLQGEVNSITWNDGSTDLGLTVNGNSTVSALVEFSNNCSIRDTVSVSFETSFSVDLGADTTLCEGFNLLLNPNVAGAAYEWQDMSTGSTFNIIDPGTYSVFVDLGTCNATDTIVVDYQSAPTTVLSAMETACDGDSILLNADIGGVATYQWADGSADATLEVKVSDTYIVTITDNACVVTDTAEVLFFSNPNLSALTDESICDGESINVGPTEQNGFNYSWSSGANTAVNEISSNGYHALTVTDANNCIASDSLFLTVRPIPVFTLGNDTTMCEGEMIDIGTSAAFAEFLWSDGTMLSTTTASAGGEYRLTATEDNCSFTDTIFVTEVAQPIVDFGMDRAICDGDSITLDATNAGASYNWSTGSSDAMISAKIAGTYIGEVSLNGCANADTINLTTEPTPIFDLGADQVLCEGDSTELMIAADPSWTINWNTGSTDDNITVYQSNNIIAETSLNGCNYSDTINVLFNPLPIVDFGMDQTICDSDSVILDATNFEATYNWNTGSSSAIVTAKADGTYIVDVDLNGCIDSDTFNLATVQTPIFDLGADQSRCDGDSVELIITADPSWTINWQHGPMDSDITVFQTNDYIAETILASCTYSDTINVLFNPLPIVDFGADQTTICDGDSLVLDVSNNGATYLWSDGSMGSSLVIKDPNRYDVTVYLNGCEFADTLSLAVAPTPFFDLGSDQDLCEGDSLELMLAADPTWDIAWSTGSTNSMITVKESDNYTAEASIGSCPFTDDIRVSFNPVPMVDLGEDIEKCEQTSLTFNIDVSNASIQWEDGSSNATRVIGSGGTYSIFVETPAGCFAEDDITITDIVCTEFKAFFPTAFTPNADGINDTYGVGLPNNVGISSYKFSIYNRWGGLMFETDDPLAQWDGLFNSKLLNAGVYIAVLDITYSDDFVLDRSETLTSDFVLMR